jgi:hypothetical protein
LTVLDCLLLFLYAMYSTIIQIRKRSFGIKNTHYLAVALKIVPHEAHAVALLPFAHKLLCTRTTSPSP